MIGEILASRSARDGETVALVANRGRDCTYHDLGVMHERVAAQLEARFAETHPVVFTRLTDHPSTVALVLSLMELACVVPLNPALSAEELQPILTHIQPDVLVIRAGDDAGRQLAKDLGAALLELAPGPRHCADFSLTWSDGPPRNAKGAPDDVALVLSTSGSTGVPKQVPITRDAIRTAAKSIVTTLDLGPSDRVVHMLPMFHIGAFVDLLMCPLLAGGQVRFAHPISTEALVTALRDEAVTWAQMVPTMLQNLIAEAPEALRAAAPHLRFIRSVSADLAPASQQKAEDLLGGVPLVQMYGMTETAGQIASNPISRGAQKPGSVGKVAGPDVRLLDSAGNPVATGNEGEICVAGPQVMKGYLGLNRSESFHGKWLRTGDIGRLDADEFLFLTGRAKEIINRGGEKIAPLEIEQALLEHPDILQAAAFALPHPTLGEVPAVALVMKPKEKTLDRAALSEFLGGRLLDLKHPRQVLHLDALPRLGSGKADKRRLKNMAKPGRNPKSDNAPLSPMAASIASIWADILQSSAPCAEDDFFDAGGDSLAAASLARRIEQVHGRKLPANTLFETPRLGELAARIEALPPAQRPSGGAMLDAVRRATMSLPGARLRVDGLLVGRGLASDTAPLFFSGMNSDLEDAIAQYRPVYTMTGLSGLRGGLLGRRLKTAANTEALARTYADEIMQIQPAGAIHLGGFCQGAVLARAVSRNLRRAGREIAVMLEVGRVFTDQSPDPTLIAWIESNDSGPAHYHEPARGYDLLYPAGWRLLDLRGDRAEALAYALEEFDARPPNAPISELAERQAMRNARLHVSAPMRPRRGESIEITVNVTNRTARPWASSCESGLRPYAKWLNLDGHIRQNAAAWTDLPPEGLAPGAQAQLKMRVPVPEVKLPMVLVVDMVDEGLGWFHAFGSRPARRLVWPR